VRKSSTRSISELEESSINSELSSRDLESLRHKSGKRRSKSKHRGKVKGKANSNVSRSILEDDMPLSRNSPARTRPAYRAATPTRLPRHDEFGGHDPRAKEGPASVTNSHGKRREAPSAKKRSKVGGKAGVPPSPRSLAPLQRNWKAILIVGGTPSLTYTYLRTPGHQFSTLLHHFANSIRFLHHASCTHAGPRSGKTSVAHRLATEFGYVALSVGDLSKEPSSGVTAARLLQLMSGSASSSVTGSKSFSNTFIIDNFPRSIDDVEVFERDIKPK
jgi:hypothetical protein